MEYQALIGLAGSAGQALISLSIYVSVALSVLLTIQPAYTLYLMIYTWGRPEAHR